MYLNIQCLVVLNIGTVHDACVDAQLIADELGIYLACYLLGIHSHVFSNRHGFVDWLHDEEQVPLRFLFRLVNVEQVCLAGIGCQRVDTVLFK